MIERARVSERPVGGQPFLAEADLWPSDDPHRRLPLLPGSVVQRSAPLVVTLCLAMLLVTETAQFSSIRLALVLTALTVVGTYLLLPWDRLPLWAGFPPVSVYLALLVAPAGDQSAGTAAAGGAILVAVALIYLAPWGGMPRWAHSAPAMFALLAVFFLRQLTTAPPTVLFPLTLLGLVWLALLHGRGELAAGFLVALIATVPPSVTSMGAPFQIQSLILVTIAALIALAVHQMTTLTRRHAEEVSSVARLVRMLAEVANPEHARTLLCDAVARLCASDRVVLFEVDQHGLLVSTAASGGRIPELLFGVEIGSTLSVHDATDNAARPECAAMTSARTGKQVIHHGLDHRRGDGVTLAKSEGASSHLAQPVMRDERCVGVLTLAWPGQRLVSAGHLRLAQHVAMEAASLLRGADLRAQLQRNAITDPLTGLPNRRGWSSELSQTLAQVRRRSSTVTVVVFDLESFKEFNDDHGHSQGDRLLRDISTAWRSALREVDVLARFGSDEFVAALPDASTAQVKGILTRIRAVTPHGQSFAAGAATWDGEESGDDLVARADALLYDTKHNRRSPETIGRGSRSSSRHRRSADANHLVGEQTIRAVYQPIINFVDGSLLGYEALARPTGKPGFARMDDIFIAAQREGLVRELDWICRRAALDGARRIDADVYINVSTAFMLDPVHDVDQMLLACHWVNRDPRTVVLEISERERVRDHDLLRETILRYRAEGFRFAVDNVDAGHTTLGLLAIADVEYIKVARALVLTITQPAPRAAVCSLVALAGSLGSVLIAGGMETSDDVERVRELGVSVGQGYLLGRPHSPRHWHQASRRVPVPESA